MGALLIYASE